jgi:hypothetical protein
MQSRSYEKKRISAPQYPISRYAQNYEQHKLQCGFSRNTGKVYERYKLYEQEHFCKGF